MNSSFRGAILQPARISRSPDASDKSPGFARSWTCPWGVFLAFINTIVALDRRNSWLSQSSRCPHWWLSYCQVPWWSSLTSCHWLWTAGCVAGRLSRAYLSSPTTPLLLCMLHTASGAAAWVGCWIKSRTVKWVESRGKRLAGYPELWIPWSVLVGHRR